MSKAVALGLGSILVMLLMFASHAGAERTPNRPSPPRTLEARYVAPAIGTPQSGGSCFAPFGCSPTFTGREFDRYLKIETHDPAVGPVPVRVKLTDSSPPVVVCGQTRRVLPISSAWIAATVFSLGGADCPSGHATSGSVQATLYPYFARTCADAVRGSLGAEWRERSIVVGPVAFVGARGSTDRPFPSRRVTSNRHPTWKILLAVQSDAIVTLQIASSHRQSASLLYDPERFRKINSYRIDHGDHTARFEACPSTTSDQEPTQFNGSIILNGAQCLPVWIWVDGKRRPLLAELPLAHHC